MSVCLRTKWLWVQIPLLSLKLWIWRLLRARSSLKTYRVWIYSETRTRHDSNIQLFVFICFCRINTIICFDSFFVNIRNWNEWLAIFTLIRITFNFNSQWAWVVLKIKVVALIRKTTLNKVIKVFPSFKSISSILVNLVI